MRRGLSAKSILMVGLRGVGKTLLLDRMRDDAERVGMQTIRIEAPEGRSLPALLAPQLRQALLRLSRNDKAKELAQRGLRALAGFAKALKFRLFRNLLVIIHWPGLSLSRMQERPRSHVIHGQYFMNMRQSLFCEIEIKRAGLRALLLLDRPVKAAGLSRCFRIAIQERSCHRCIGENGNPID